MTLDEFISQTLHGIISGIAEAQAKTKDKGAIINPKGYEHTMRGKSIDNNGNVIETVDFDIALTTNEGTQTKGGIGVFMGPIGAGSQGSSNNQNSTVNKIKFSVQVIFPRGG